ncbi:MAG: GlsB/YeaQ/YmgE family stress response membrane protein [Proteobacteria bacterium]|nr:GlsB/YeaQ/YmgE family stress response membrane protein [Pseudomonadota bacterium]MDE2412947.1 GlsB/YeaQ/YmgE family stress response membrane protein [Sphingomonadales bacterium]
MFNLIGAIFSGLIVGALARYFYPGGVEMGWGMTALLGIGGSLLAGLIVSRGNVSEGFHRAGCLASIVGAMALIFIGRHMGWHF